MKESAETSLSDTTFEQLNVRAVVGGLVLNANTLRAVSQEVDIREVGTLLTDRDRSVVERIRLNLDKARQELEQRGLSNGN